VGILTRLFFYLSRVLSIVFLSHRKNKYTRMMTTVESLVEQFKHFGMTDYFVVNGGAIAPFIDAVSRNPTVKYYCFNHEQAAAMAAEGYYRASGKVAIVLVTSGPGVQNILNGVCGCWYDSIPALFISGQVNTSDSLSSIFSKPRQVGFQETEVESMFSTCTLYTKMILNLADVDIEFSKAVNLLFHEKRKGPVLIDFPVNLQMSRKDVIINRISNFVDFDFVPDLTEVILTSKRPIVIIGHGARNSCVIDWLKIPCVTSWGGVDVIPHDHLMWLGSLGVYGDRIANFAVQNADLLIILGSRLDTRQTGGNLKAFSRFSKKIMVDIDIEEIRKMEERGIHLDYPLNTTVQNFISKNPSHGEWIEWLSVIQTWKNEFGRESTRTGEIYSILENIQFPEECIIIADTGATLVWAVQSIRLGPKQRLFSSFANSSMGYSLPSAIGAAISKSVPVVCIIGDGGIQMNIQEFATLKNFNLPVSVFIVNNAGYGIIKQFQDSYLGGRYSATAEQDLFGKRLDFTKIAQAYGLETSDWPIVSEKGPIVHEICIHPNQKIYPKLDFGNSLENMSPLLPDLHLHMIVEPVPVVQRSGWVSPEELDKSDQRQLSKSNGEEEKVTH
jgi:acetolactate synthase-1/2/3 large subunit